MSGRVSSGLQIPLSMQTPPFSACEWAQNGKLWTLGLALLWLCCSLPCCLCWACAERGWWHGCPGGAAADGGCASLPSGCLRPGHAQQRMGAAVLGGDWLEPSCHHRRWEIVITGNKETAAFSRSVGYCCHPLSGQGRWIQKVRAVKDFFIMKGLSVSDWLWTHLIWHHSLFDLKVIAATRPHS